MKTYELHAGQHDADCWCRLVRLELPRGGGKAALQCRRRAEDWHEASKNGLNLSSD